jgi:peptide-methionine (R)-S-oxide reductase
MTILRRDFIKFALSGLGVVAIAPYLKAVKARAAEVIDKLTLSNDVWKTRLTPEQYDILREEGTEHPFTSALLNEHREGMFACVACDLPLFPSSFKFDSGTGWPSFFDAIPAHLETKTDYKLIAPRNEYHCARCGGHHGHVFKDGPAPTGLRYCNNGAVLKFIPKEA